MVSRYCPDCPGTVRPTVVPVLPLSSPQDPTAHPLHDAAAGGEPQPVSGYPGPTADKWFEDLLTQVGGNALAVVAAAHRPRPVPVLSVDADPGGVSAPVLDRVLDDVLKPLRQ